MNKNKRVLLNDFDANIDNSIYFAYWDDFRNDSIIDILEVMLNDFN